MIEAVEAVKIFDVEAPNYQKESLPAAVWPRKGVGLGLQRFF